MEETPNVEVVVEKAPQSFSIKRFIRSVVIVILAFSFGYCHYSYSHTLFENDRNFSHLSELEREMSLRTEMGFYYSYYKIMAEDTLISRGVTKIMYDKRVEYPNEVNACSRFNVHPEIFLGALYRYLEPVLNNSNHVECHAVSRPGMEPVESCNGLGVPILFYLEAVWVLAGLALAAIFLHATAISDSVLGGVLAVCQFFANHKDATRVHWTPNERENFAWPLLLLQSWLVAVQLRGKDLHKTFVLQMGVFFLNGVCLLSWQFTQFILCTQIFIFFIMEQLYLIDNKALCVYLHSHFCGIHMAMLLMQGNDMLKTSIYSSFFAVVAIYVLCLGDLRVKIENRVDIFVEAWLILVRICIAFSSAIYLKKLIGEFLGTYDDSHIWNLLFSKFNSNYSNFHTLLYTCSAAYGFLPLKTVYDLCKTTLIPTVFLSLCLVVNRYIQNGRKIETMVVIEDAQSSIDDDDSGIENNPEIKLRKRKKLRAVNDEEETKDKWVEFVSSLNIEPHVFYTVAQLIAYGVMAALVMRLKLLFVSQLCIASGLLVNKKLYVLPKPLKKYMKFVPALWTLVGVILVYAMFNNVTKELSYLSEFEDAKLEELLLWIKNSTIPGAAFAGSMPVSAAVMLSTRRPIVAHPHYENLGARARAYAVYKVYGRFTSQEMYEELTNLKASYLIVESQYCYGRSSLNCTYKSIWDHERPDLTSKPTLCHVLSTTAVDHFYPIFKNSHYTVYRVHDMSVNIVYDSTVSSLGTDVTEIRTNDGNSIIRNSYSAVTCCKYFNEF